MTSTINQQEILVAEIENVYEGKERKSNVVGPRRATELNDRRIGFVDVCLFCVFFFVCVVISCNVFAAQDLCSSLTLVCVPMQIVSFFFV